MLQNTKSERRDEKREKSGAKYPAVHFLFFAFRTHFRVFHDKCIAGLMGSVISIPHNECKQVFLIVDFSIRTILRFLFLAQLCKEKYLSEFFLIFIKYTRYPKSSQTLWFKLATHYSSLFANNDKIIFSRKNLNFAKRGEDTPIYCSSSTAVFANMNISFRATKNRLWVSSRNHSVERRWRRTQNEKPVRETLAKMLYTLFAFRSFFVISLIFCYCSR